VVLITGGASGIGAAFVRAFTEDEYKKIIAALP
jgi:NAD(P)-dependent dehydrogenase (short-subunit alcohol dehydrogenase family)